MGCLSACDERDGPKQQRTAPQERKCFKNIYVAEKPVYNYLGRGEAGKGVVSLCVRRTLTFTEIPMKFSCHINYCNCSMCPVVLFKFY